MIPDILAFGALASRAPAAPEQPSLLPFPFSPFPSSFALGPLPLALAAPNPRSSEPTIPRFPAILTIVALMSVQVTRRLFTVDDYRRMVDAGILSERDRVELIEGEVVAMTPIGIAFDGNRFNRTTVTASFLST